MMNTADTALHAPTAPDYSCKISHTMKQAAVAAGLSVAFLYAQIASGKLVARKAAGRTLIEDSELRRFIAALPALRTRARQPTDPEPSVPAVPMSRRSRRDPRGAESPSEPPQAA